MTWKEKLKIRKRRLAEAIAARRKTRERLKVYEATVKKRSRMVQTAKKFIARAKSQSVREPANVVRRSPNQSSRGGVKPAIIVLHTTEGSYAGAVSWLQNPKSQGSSNVVVSAKGESTRLVDDDAKAWAQADFNPQALSIEQEGRAAQTSWPDAQLQTVAKWIAYWSKKHGIPITHSTTRGVCQHKNLGQAGGGHVDCGDAYPEAKVLALARGYAKNGW